RHGEGGEPAPAHPHDVVERRGARAARTQMAARLHRVSLPSGPSPNVPKLPRRSIVPGRLQSGIGAGLGGFAVLRVTSTSNVTASRPRCTTPLRGDTRR